MTGGHSSGHAASAHSVMAPHEIAMMAARGGVHPSQQQALTTAEPTVATQAIQQWPAWAAGLWVAITLAALCVVLYMIAADPREGDTR